MLWRRTHFFFVIGKTGKWPKDFTLLEEKCDSLGGSGIDTRVGVVDCNTVYTMREEGKRAAQEEGVKGKWRKDDTKKEGKIDGTEAKKLKKKQEKQNGAK